MLRKLLGFLLFLPNLTPAGPLFRSEIFPWAFLFALRRSLQLSWPYLAFVAYLSLSALIMFPSLGSPLVPARALFAYVNATVIFFALIACSDKEYRFLNKAVLIVLLVHVGVSLLQYSGSFPRALVPVMRFFVERFTAEIYGGGRGVAGLYAEPAYAAVAVHYFFAYLMLVHNADTKKLPVVALIVALALYDIFILRSFVGLVMFVIYVLSLFNRRQLIVAGIVTSVSLAILIRTLGPRDDAPRAITIAYNLIFEQEYTEFIPWLVENSGFRFISVWGAYLYGIVHPFGSGIGAWSNASISAMEALGLPAETIAHFASEHGGQFEGVRPTAFAAGLMLEAGVVGLALFLLTFLPYLWRRDFLLTRHARPIWLFFMFNTFALGSIGDPIPFAILALSLRTLSPPEAEEEMVSTTVQVSAEISDGQD
ncbi:MAG: hypothetical protein LWX09_05085 [Bacteroidia bacterium]|nr:hypothetical protein [Bacteroidia bacterium]